MTIRRAVSFLPGPLEGAGQTARATMPASELPASSAVTDAASPADVAPASASAPEASAAGVVAVHEWLLAAAKPDQARDQVQMLRALEDLSAGLSAVQAQLMVELDQGGRDQAHQTVATAQADPAGRSVPITVRSAEREAARSVRGQVALALRISPRRAGTLIGAAKMLHTEMPHTLTRLHTGHLTHQRAIILVKETACLEIEDRARVDTELCADPATFEGVGTQELEARAKKRAAELDPAAAAARAAKTAKDRSVSIRPAPEAMVRLSALLPVAEGVRVYACLKTAADTTRTTNTGTSTDTDSTGGTDRTDGGSSAGTEDSSERSRAQIMADTLVERVTGQETADQVPVTVNLIISDRTLLAAGHEPAIITDETGRNYGPVPAQVARNLTATGLDHHAAWLRAVYANPTGGLVATTSKRRFYAGGLADLLRIRDQGICRTPWCDAPAKHLDHATPAATGGPTTQHNGQGLCEACNHTKEAPGWNATTDTDPATGRHRTTTITPTGHHYESVAPPPPRPAT